MFKPVTKWADTLLTPGATPEMIRHAFNLAQTERPGAVYLAIPQDVEAHVRIAGTAAPARASGARRGPGPGPDRPGGQGCWNRPRPPSSWPDTGRPATGPRRP